MSKLNIGHCDPNKTVDLNVLSEQLYVNKTFNEYRRVLSRAFADMVDDDLITEWQAGYYFACLLCYYNERSFEDGIKSEG